MKTMTRRQAEIRARARWGEDAFAEEYEDDTDHICRVGWGWHPRKNFWQSVVGIGSTFEEAFAKCEEAMLLHRAQQAALELLAACEASVDELSIAGHTTMKLRALIKRVREGT